MRVVIDAPEYDTHDFVIKQGATEPAINAQLTDDAGNPINLTGASVEFRMRSAGADSRQADDGCVLTDADNGEVAYEWRDGDTDTVDHYNAEFAVDYSGATGSNFDADEYFPSDEYLSIQVRDHL